MNPGETQPRRGQDDAELGEALHHRLSQLAARLQRLTGGDDAHRSAAGESLTEAQLASDAFDDRSLSSSSDLGLDQPMPVERPASSPRDNAGVDRIANALRDLERDRMPSPASIDAPPAHSNEPPQTSDPRSAEARLRSIRERIAALKERHGDGSSRSADPSFAERAERRPPPRDRNAAIEEITARQRVIDDRPESRPPASTGLPHRPSHDQSGDRREGMTDIRRRIDEMARDAGRSAPPPSVKPTAFPPPLPGADSPGAIIGKLDNLQRTVEAFDRSPGIEAIRVSQEVLERRIDEIARHGGGSEFSAVAQQMLHRLPSSERFDALSAELDRLAERIASGDQSGALVAIADRLESFEQRLSGVGEAGRSAQKLDAEIAGLRDAVEDLYRMLHNNGSPALTRLEERLTQLSTRLENTLDDAPRADSVTDLLGRLELIAARGETAPAALESLASEIAELRARERSELASLDTHIQTLAERLDTMIDGQARERAETEELEGRIAALSARLDHLAAATPSQQSQNELAQMEQQLAALTGRLEEISTEGGGGLNRLDQQVAALMQRVEMMSTDGEALRAVQENLTELETVVQQSAPQSAEAIQSAAREAVRELSGLGGQDSEEIRGLKADLRELQAAANGDRNDTGATLDRVVHRLSALEDDVRGKGDRAIGDEPIPPAMPRSKPVSRSESPAASDQAAQTMRIQPGARRSEPSQDAGPAPGSDRERRADFIAAARRAAQAAAAEHGAASRSSIAEHDDGERVGSSPGRLARLGNAIGNHRRPILIAAAAVVLAIAAFQIARPLLNSDPETAEAPAAEQGAAPEALAPAIAPETPAVDLEALNGNPAAASPAFIPPDGVVSPRSEITPVADVDAPPVVPTPPSEPIDAAEEAVGSVYPMPEDAIGSVRLRVAAANGDPAALYEVGSRYADGNGVARDLAEAVVWLERSAEAGLAVAQHRLAAQHEAGLGVPTDRATAFRWYSAAAEQGNVMAMHNLGVMLSQGIDADPDFAGAIEWFKTAAEHGIRDSQYNLGVIHARGIGIEPDMPTSYLWFALAAGQGDSDAAARRDEIAGILSADELATARALVSAWSATGAPAAANMVEVPEGGWDAADEQVGNGDRQQLVLTIQNLLSEKGFDPGPTDGVAGPKTLDAVRDFQSTIGVQQTGRIDTQLLTALTN